MTRPIRVIQWATGSMGKACLRAVLDDDRFQLVGLLVYGEAKAGRDAGDIARRPETGVIATRSIDEILAGTNMVAEGVKTSKVVMELAAEYGVDLPIAESVFSVVHEGAPATDAYRGLLGRNVRSEMHGMPSA